MTRSQTVSFSKWIKDWDIFWRDFTFQVSRFLCLMYLRESNWRYKLVYSSTFYDMSTINMVSVRVSRDRDVIEIGQLRIPRRPWGNSLLTMNARLMRGGFPRKCKGIQWNYGWVSGKAESWNVLELKSYRRLEGYQ